MVVNYEILCDNDCVFGATGAAMENTKGDEEMEYDYKKAVREDIKNYLNDNGITLTESNRETVYDDMFVSDSVTGNGSGSYTFSAYKAEEYLCHNLDLLAEAVDEFGDGVDVLKKGAEACDVTIRCYLLGQILDEFIQDDDETDEND